MSVMNQPFHDIAIATRKLLLASGPETTTEVSISLEKPVPVTGSAEWRCAYRIVGPGANVMNYATGVDALQAVQLAIVMVETEIDVRFSESELMWDDGTPYRNGVPPGS